MKSIFRKILSLSIIIILLFCFVKRDLLIYGFQQARGQLKIIYHAKPIEDFLQNEQFPDSLKAKLLVVQKVKDFAQNKLEFSSSEQYTKMYDQKGKAVMWVVTAAYPYKLENYEWKFPVLGKVSYKGFFVEEEARSLAAKLEQDGFDVRVRTASAWSTLGWLNDPILSEVLSYSEGRLVELIFHELIHDEIFIADSVDFNENLASFFGKEFTKMFYQSNLISSSETYKHYLDLLEDRQKLNEFVVDYIPKFAELYEEIAEYGAVEKANQKYNFMEQFEKELKNLQFKNSKYSEFLNDDLEINNAFLLSFDRYSGQQELLKKSLVEEYDNDILKMWNDFKEKYESI